MSVYFKVKPIVHTLFNPILIHLSFFAYFFWSVAQCQHMILTNVWPM